MTPAGSSYDAALTELATRLPRLAAALRRAEQQRVRVAVPRLHGARLKGLDELLRHLDEVHQAFTANAALSRIAYLIHRSRADLETATEATLSGYVAVVADAMRDVMEIENLLLDFAVNPAHIDEWSIPDRKTRLRKFDPAKVRARLHAAGDDRYSATGASPCYQVHSETLHVSPSDVSWFPRGCAADDELASDIGFWEIFEHARRLLHAIQRLTGALAPGSAVDEIAGQELVDVQDAWRRTQDMQEIVVAFARVAARTQTDEGGTRGAAAEGVAET